MVDPQRMQICYWDSIPLHPAAWRISLLSSGIVFYLKIGSSFLCFLVFVFFQDNLLPYWDSSRLKLFKLLVDR